MAVCVECSFESCKPLKRILEILRIYESWLQTNGDEIQNSVVDVISTVFGSFSNKQIIDDYNHIKHKNYKITSTICSQSSSFLSECISSKRHIRSKDKNPEAIYKTSDIKEILLQKMLDQIHLFLYHPINNLNQYNNKQNRHNRFGSIIHNKTHSLTDNSIGSESDDTITIEITSGRTT